MLQPTRLILIRHGHTSGNGGGDGALQGGRTDVPLSTRGRDQVRRLQDRLRGSVPFAVIASSPMQRAWETATTLREAGLGPVCSFPALREIDCGTLDGMPLREVEHRFPELWEINRRQSDERFRWPGGESYRELRARCLGVVRALVLAHRGDRLALVTHAGVISQILGFLAGVSPGRWECFRPRHTTLTEIDWMRGSGTVLTFDDGAHLPDDRW
jgi:broad specificity phosphatase PhoE